MTTNIKPTRQDLLQIAADYADLCVLVTTSDLDAPGPKIVYVNAAFTGMTGYSLPEILGKTPRILQGPDTDSQMLARFKSALKSGKDFIGRTTNYKQNGEPFELEWITTHLRDSSGQTTHYIALQRDITGVNRAEHDLAEVDDELRTAKSKLIESTKRLESVERSLAEKARFAAHGEISAGVVHDLSNALTPIFGLIDLLHSMDNLPPDARKITGDLDVGIEHALNLISNLRDYHSADEGKQHEPVELRTLIHRLPDLTKGKWTDPSRPPGSGVGFAFELQDSAIVLGSDVEILQVLINLVLNAIDAMPDGGTVTVAMAVESNRVKISVSDTGIGMSEELALNCFKPYVKGRSTGTGLGLSVCRRIVEAHGGTIEADPSPDQGVTFRIELPLPQTI